MDLRTLHSTLLGLMLIVGIQSCNWYVPNEKDWSFNPTILADTLFIELDSLSLTNPPFDSSDEQEVKKFKARFHHLYDKILYFTKIDSSIYFVLYRGDTTFSTIDPQLGIYDLNEETELGMVDQNGIEIIPFDNHKIYNLGTTINGYFTTRSKDGYQLYDVQGKALLPSPFPVIIPSKDQSCKLECKKGQQICIVQYPKLNKDTVDSRPTHRYYWHDAHQSLSFLMTPPPYDQLPFQNYLWLSDSSILRKDLQMIFDHAMENAILHVVSINEYPLAPLDSNPIQSYAIISHPPNACHHSNVTLLNIIQDSLCGQIIQCKILDQSTLEIKACFQDEIPYSYYSEQKWMTNYHYYHILENGLLVRLDKDGFFDASSICYLDSSYLIGFSDSKNHLQFMNESWIDLMRNELLARTGFSFTNAFWDTLFKQTDWYGPSNEPTLTAIERYNLQWMLSLNNALDNEGSKNPAVTDTL